jgi:hypothetical protein
LSATCHQTSQSMLCSVALLRSKTGLPTSTLTKITTRSGPSAIARSTMASSLISSRLPTLWPPL